MSSVKKKKLTQLIKTHEHIEEKKVSFSVHSIFKLITKIDKFHRIFTEQKIKLKLI